MNEPEIALSIVVVDPPPGVTFCLQRGKAESVDPQESSGGPLAFDLTLRARLEGATVRLLGPFAQGPPSQRFVYVSSGTLAGQAASCWTRRAKVPLAGVTPELVRRALAAPAARLEGRISGRSQDGGPACATVPLLGDGWSLVEGDD